MTVEILIDPRGNGGEQFWVEAGSVSSALDAAASRIFPNCKKHMRIERVTGDGGSGMFQVYVHAYGETETTHGRMFHAMI